MRFPDFAEFKLGTQRSEAEPDSGDESRTPEEMLESSFQTLRRTLAHELLERVKSRSPKFFEELVIDLLVSMGYGGSRENAGAAVGLTGDGGVDGIISEDKLGLDVVYVQAKRWQSRVRTS